MIYKLLLITSVFGFLSLLAASVIVLSQETSSTRPVGVLMCQLFRKPGFRAISVGLRFGLCL